MRLQVDEVPEDLQEGTDGYYGVVLARLDDTTDAADVAEWDAQNPPPYEALGGVEYYPPNQPAYLTADLKPGRYAWAWYYEGMEEPLTTEFTVE